MAHDAEEQESMPLPGSDNADVAPNERARTQPAAPRAKQPRRKRAYYQDALTPEEAAAYAEALGKTGLGDEVALIRAKLRALLEAPAKSDPPRLADVLRAVDVLVRALRVDKLLGDDGDDPAQQLVERVLREYRRREQAAGRS